MIQLESHQNPPPFSPLIRIPGISPESIEGFFLTKFVPFDDIGRYFIESRLQLDKNQLVLGHHVHRLGVQGCLAKRSFKT
jgi:hypothetical protein